MRETASKRQGGVCYWCDRPLDNDCTADHLTRLADGGRTNITNIVAAHAKCNNTRHQRPRKRHAK